MVGKIVSQNSPDRAPETARPPPVGGTTASDLRKHWWAILGSNQ